MKKTLFLFLLMVISIFPPLYDARAGDPQTNCTLLPTVEWRETRTQAFAVLYPVELEAMGRTITDLYGNVLDAEYSRFETLFEASLKLPVSIRLYPNQDYYSCLNAQAPALQPGATHGHVGSREIVFMADGIRANVEAWSKTFVDVYRFELGTLFVEAITEGKAPVGLPVALGHYVQDPTQTIGSLNLQRVEWQAPSHSWSELWEDPDLQSDFRRELQATSTVAYLIDAHGWPAFLTYLEGLRTSDSYRKSLAAVFGKEVSVLEDEWAAYYPLYFSGRWQTNVLYNYDLSPFQKLLDEGAYADAEKGLKPAIEFLSKMHQNDRLAQAQGMLDRARVGMEAGALISQSRQALQSGDHNQAIDLVNQAEARYNQLGNYRRLDEISAYRSQVQKIVELHGELDQLQARVAGEQNSFLLAGQLIQLGQRMAALGDVQGQMKALELSRVLEVEQRDQQEWISALIAGVVLFLLGIRILMLWRRPAPEANL